MIFYIKSDTLITFFQEGIANHSEL